jgi:putative oxidoreductase
MASRTAAASLSPNPWTARLFLAGRLLLAVVFLYAAYTKMPWKQPAALFALTIDSYQVLPPWAVIVVAKTLPWFELSLGVLLLIGWPLRVVSTFTTLLLGGFFALMVRTYALGLEINCGCFGPGEHLGAKTLTRDGLLLTLSLLVAVGAYRRLRRWSLGGRLPEAPQGS